MPQKLVADNSTLKQILAWCIQVARHCLNQCWSKFMLSYGVTRPQWVNTAGFFIRQSHLVWYHYFKATARVCRSDSELTKMFHSLPGSTGGLPTLWRKLTMLWWYKTGWGNGRCIKTIFSTILWVDNVTYGLHMITDAAHFQVLEWLV